MEEQREDLFSQVVVLITAILTTIQEYVVFPGVRVEIPIHDDTVFVHKPAQGKNRWVYDTTCMA